MNMTDATIRELTLGADVLARLVRHAQTDGVSLEDELVQVIRAGLAAREAAGEGAAGRVPLASRVRLRMAALGGVTQEEFAPPARELLREPPDFGGGMPG